MSDIQSKITRYTKKQGNMIHKQDKWLKTVTDVRIIHKNIKQVIITVS